MHPAPPKRNGLTRRSVPDGRIRRSGTEEKGAEMNWNIVEGNWKQFKGMIRGQWGRLTGDPVDEIVGKGDQLAGKVQETYGSVQDNAEKTVSQVEERGKK
jgi:uncharacterized protein YjbJ (UPF0337 family)